MEYPEGATPLDPDERDGLLMKQVETRGELDEVENQNILQGYQWLDSQRKHTDFLSETFVRDLHRHLFGEVWKWAGQFRQTEKTVGLDPLQIAVQLRDLLEDAKYWVKNHTYHREEFAARFHHRLVTIHPFPNGNGRHARIMTDVILEKVLGVAPVNWGRETLSEEGEHRQAYLEALRAADRHDYAPLIAFIRDGDK